MTPPRRAALATLALLATGPARAEVAGGALCQAQAAAVERGQGLPPGLLQAVGRVESGRTDVASHGELPWPWTVDDEGVDHVFTSAFDAIAYVVAARARGSQSLDVGCFQVNLQYHPDAFATLAEAFDPAANARYAGQMLTDFHARSGSWDKAVQWYHSATPWRGEMYRNRVLSRWEEAGLAAQPQDPQAAMPVTRTLVQTAPAASRSGAALRPLAQVQSPAEPPALTTPRGRRLPRVIVPSVYAGR